MPCLLDVFIIEQCTFLPMIVLKLYPAPSWLVSDRLSGGLTRTDTPSPPHPSRGAELLLRMINLMSYSTPFKHELCTRTDTTTSRHASIIFLGPWTLTLGSSPRLSNDYIPPPGLWRQPVIYRRGSELALCKHCVHGDGYKFMKEIRYVEVESFHCSRGSLSPAIQLSYFPSIASVYFRRWTTGVVLSSTSFTH